MVVTVKNQKNADQIEFLIIEIVTNIMNDLIS